ncbi:MAG TPA: sialidase family protein [Planctomycetaceae bacterium]|nr:sialidase family protein [Planctomycetaceae bacterium]
MRCRVRTLLWMLLATAAGLWGSRAFAQDADATEGKRPRVAPERVSYSARLPSGEMFDAGELWSRERTVFERRFDRMQARLVELPFGDGKLRFTRNMSALHGVLSGESGEGEPVLSVQYRDGHRQGTLLVWDDRGRPLLLAQYDRKKLHGWRCVFLPCSEGCETSHLTLLQKWERGRLEESYFVFENRAVPVRDEDSNDPARRKPAYTAAHKLLGDFEEQYAANEKQLKQLVREEGRARRQQLEFDAAALSGSLLAEAVDCGFI